MRSGLFVKDLRTSRGPQCQRHGASFLAFYTDVGSDKHPILGGWPLRKNSERYGALFAARRNESVSSSESLNFDVFHDNKTTNFPDKVK